MKHSNYALEDRFRVWIAAYDQWQPKDSGEIPPTAVALEPAEEDPMSRSRAAAYVEAFNRTALDRPGKIWAVAVPVTLRYEGDPVPGQMIAPRNRLR